MSQSPVQRYDGCPLGDRPHIAVLGSCKVGNFVVTLPLLRALRRLYPQALIDFWGSEATADFEKALVAQAGLLDWRISWDAPHGSPLEAWASAAQIRQAAAGPLDLLVNCDGFNPVTQVLASVLRPRWVAGGALTANLRRDLPWGEAPQQRFLADPDWDSPAFLQRYSGTFGSNYIAELLCQMVFVQPTQEELSTIELPWQEPPFTVPPLLIHCTTTRSAKIWPFGYWHEVLTWCQSQGLRVGLVGAPPARQADEYHAGNGEESLLASFGGESGILQDLRGQTSLIQLAGACRAARAVVSVDAGPLHIAAAVGVPTLALVGNDGDAVGASPIRLWLPRASTMNRTVSEVSCHSCEERRFRNEACVEASHRCMEGVSPQQVIRWLAARFDR